MIHHVIFLRVREDQLRGDLPEQVDRLLQSRFVVYYHSVALVEAMVGGADQRRGTGRLGDAAGADVPTVLGHRATIARCGRSDMDLPAGGSQPDQGAGAG